MPRRFFKKLLPPASKFKEDSKFKYIHRFLHDPNLWHLNRHSLSGAMAVGLFVAFLPMPLQMLLAAALAVVFSVNLPLSVTLVWITNPLTIAPAIIFAYQLGAWALDLPPEHLNFALNSEWVRTELHQAWKPLITGSLILSTASASIGYLGTHILWRLSVVRRLTEKRNARTLLKRQRLLEELSPPSSSDADKESNDA